jgi:hypothetical protein
MVFHGANVRKAEAGKVSFGAQVPKAETNAVSPLALLSSICSATLSDANLAGFNRFFAQDKTNRDTPSSFHVNSSTVSDR